MSETSSTTLPAGNSETVTQLPKQPVTTSDQSKPSASPAGGDKEVLVDDDGEEYEIEYEYEDDENDVHRERNNLSGDEEDEEYYRIANRIDELLNKASDLRDEVSVPKTLPMNDREIPQTESSQSASGDADDEYEYEYEYEDEEEPQSEGDVKNDQLTKQTIDQKNPSSLNSPTKELPASQAITQSPFQEELPDFGQLRHASNKWNIAAISGEDAEMNFDDDDEECNEIEIALEEPAAKIVGQLEQLLEEDEQDEVDELMPDGLIQQTPTSNPALHWAAAEGHNDVVETLLNRGADPNLKTTDPEALSPGEMAYMKGHEEIGDQILNATFANEAMPKSTPTVQTYPLQSNNDVDSELMDMQAKNGGDEEQQKTSSNQPIGLEVGEKELEVQNKLNNNQSEPEVQIQYENEQIVNKTEDKDAKFATKENTSEEAEIGQNTNEEEEKVPKLEEYTHNSGVDLSVESELADSLLRSAIDSANFELSLKQLQENASAGLDSLSGPELRKRTTLVIDEWDEDTKRALANQTQQQRRRSSTTALTDGRSLVLSLIIAALLFLLFRTLFGAIFS